MMSGKGKLTIKKREKLLYSYKGNFIDNKKDGYGEMTYTDGKSYTGFYKDDKRNGYGILVTDLQTNYTGQWEQGKMHGQGTLTTKDLVQKGEWQMG